MRREKLLLLGCILLESLVCACAVNALDADTALKLARDQSQVLAAAWESNTDVIDARVNFDIERSSAIDFASSDAYPKGRFCGPKLMQKLGGQNGLLKLVRNEYMPAFTLGPAHVTVEYELRAGTANAKYDSGQKRVRIRVMAPVVERIEEFVERGSVSAVAKLEVGFRPTDVGAELLKALEELRREETVDPQRLHSPDDDLLIQLLDVETNMKRRETRYLRYERTDAGWQVAKLQ